MFSAVALSRLPPRHILFLQQLGFLLGHARVAGTSSPYCFAWVLNCFPAYTCQASTGPTSSLVGTILFENSLHAGGHLHCPQSRPSFANKAARHPRVLSCPTPALCLAPPARCRPGGRASHRPAPQLAGCALPAAPACSLPLTAPGAQPSTPLGRRPAQYTAALGKCKTGMLGRQRRAGHSHFSSSSQPSSRWPCTCPSMFGGALRRLARAAPCAPHLSMVLQLPPEMAAPPGQPLSCQPTKKIAPLPELNS